MMLSFKDLGLSSAMLSNLEQLGYQNPTEIQSLALPEALSGNDVIAMAQTGSGKTAAFGIALVERLDPRLFAPQGLVLCPTRELADQVAKALREMARARGNIKVLTLCGGVSIGPQIGSLTHGAHLIVGTPGRIQDHLRKGTLSLRHVRSVVLDEADRMLDMGFQEIVEDILSESPATRQTLLFSATWPAGIRKLSARFQNSPVDIRAESVDSGPDIDELFFEIAPGQEPDAIMALVSRYQPASCIVFCSTRQQCDELAVSLDGNGFPALALHGDLEQKDRDSVLVRFANQSCPILVATDVAARGLDIKSLPLVINAEPARDPDVHTHRVGRTGRAGEKGVAVTLCTPSKSHKINRIEQARGQSVQWGDSAALLAERGRPMVPEYMTLCIAGGRKDKVRPGDILGALTGDAGLPGDAVGKIDLFDFQAFVAVKSDYAHKAKERLGRGKIKGRKIPVRFA